MASPAVEKRVVLPVPEKGLVRVDDFLRGLGGSVPEKEESEVGETVYERDEYCD